VEDKEKEGVGRERTERETYPCMKSETPRGGSQDINKWRVSFICFNFMAAEKYAENCSGAGVGGGID
jgi:hypothetical protein